MPRKEVVHYIKKQLKKGHHIDDIKHQLISVGHVLEDVEHAVAHIYHKKFSTQIMLVSLLLVVLVVSVIYSQNGNSETTEKGAGMSTVVESETYAKQSPPVEQETAIAPRITAEDSAVIDNAVNMNDLSLCEQLSSNAKDSCMDRIYINRAVSEDNAGLCGGVKNLKTLCFDNYYYEKAESTGDLSFCDKITTLMLRSGCKNK